ncbi:MAG: ABC transporter ATP-binding protein [Alphaproteobacteria bacterium]|nr:ABC transporter ATP-binding protein [Alphaproteobacteria bacterium]MCB9794535.1 ABC transporter ATP-binding protein [Alphaproteobacteria bacterium]
MAIVSVKGARREYRQGQITVKALNGVDLDIEPGEFTALMGPSGSGKTTLLNLIGGLDEPSGGSIVVDGKDLAQMSAAERSKMRLERIGFVFQAYNLIPVLSAFENAEFVMMMMGASASEREARVMQTLKDVGLEGMEHRRPNELSGGQQQRVAVARAIASQPAIVLADEPTANLDSHTGTELVEMMRRLNEEEGITFIFATHDPKVMDRAKRVVTLVDGKIAKDERR